MTQKLQDILVLLKPLHLVKHKFLWPSLKKDTESYVAKLPYLCFCKKAAKEDTQAPPAQSLISMDFIAVTREFRKYHDFLL